MVPSVVANATLMPLGNTFPPGVWPAEFCATDAVICDVCPAVIVVGFALAPRTSLGVTSSVPVPLVAVGLQPGWPGPALQPHQLLSPLNVAFSADAPVSLLAIRLNAAFIVTVNALA